MSTKREHPDWLRLANGLTIPGGHDWYAVRAEQGDEEATVSIYDEIGFWGTTAQDFADAMGQLPSSVGSIHVRLNSPGGSVFDGLAIANVLRDHAASVRVTVDGMAASIASVIAMAGDTVTMGRGSQMMIHNPSGLVLGGSADMRQMADLLDKLALDSIAGAYDAKAGKAGGGVDAWLDRMAAETWYSGPEAVAVGLADATTDDPQNDPENRGTRTARDTARVHDVTAHGWRYPGRAAAPDPAAEEIRTRARATVARVRASRKEQ